MNMDFIECERHYREVYIECVGECNTDYSCSSQCSREFEAQTKNCPCKENCPNGCPCTDYSCPDSTTTEELTTTTIPSAKKSILILSTFGRRDPDGPVITDSTGKVSYAGEDFNFEYDDNTEVEHGCSVTYRGEFYVYGSSDKTQIAKVNGCKLERVGSLSFYFYYGGCDVVNEQEIYICFSSYEKKQCYVGTNPLGQFSQVAKSKYIHDGTNIASNKGESVILSV